jgi:hypothetical protein
MPQSELQALSELLAQFSDQAFHILACGGSV